MISLDVSQTLDTLLISVFIVGAACAIGAYGAVVEFQRRHEKGKDSYKPVDRW